MHNKAIYRTFTIEDTILRQINPSTRTIEPAAHAGVTIYIMNKRRIIIE